MSRFADLVLLHGGKQASWVWDETIAAIRAQAGDVVPRIVTLDIPGCGAKRGRHVASLTHGAVIADLAADIDRAGVRGAAIVGHSQAGTVIPRLIAARPDAFARAIYVTCAAPAEGQTIGAMLGTGKRGDSDTAIGWPLDPATTPPAELFAAMFCNDMDAAQMSAFMARLGQDEWPPACGAIETQWGYAAAAAIAPPAYVVALRDGILPPEWQERFAERIGAVAIERIDAGHQLMQTRPHALAELLLEQARIAAQTPGESA